MTGDVLKIDIQGESAKLQSAIDAANIKAKELRKTIIEIEKEGGKGSENWQKYKNELKSTQEQAAKLTKEMKTMDVTKLTIRQLEIHAKDLAKELKNADRSSQDFTKNAKRLTEVEKELEKAKKQAKGISDEADNLAKPGLWGKISSGVKGLGTAFQAIMALQVIQWIVGIGKEIFTTTAGFEKYEKVLTTALGSQKDAKNSMEAIKKMAAQTTFGVDELTEGYVKMVNRGLRPGQKEMTSMADLAASQGKTFDQLTEAVLDAMSGENERLKEFGISAKKSGDETTLSFKGMQQTVKNTPEAINAAIIAFGEMEGVAGQNAKMMETLDGKSSNLGDTMDNLMVIIGNGLSPIFKFFLDLLSDGIGWLIKIVSSSDPVVAVFQDLFSVVEDTAAAFFNIFSNIFPSFNAEGKVLDKVMQGIGLAFRAVLIPTQLVIGILGDVFEAIGGVVQGGKALVQVLSGDFAGAVTSFENAKSSFTKVGSHATDSFEKIKKGWREAFVDQPKKDTPEAVFAGGDLENKRQNAITEEQKKGQDKQAKEKEKQLKKDEAAHAKHLADVHKANEEALKKLGELEDKQFVERIADEQTRDIVRLQQKAERALNANQESLASEEIKARQEKAIIEQLGLDIAKVQADYRDKKIKADEAAALKTKEANAYIRQQETAAIATYYDYLELTAKGNTTKLTAIKKERLNEELRLTKEKLAQEEAAEIAKATKTITDETQLSATLTNIRNQYQQQEILAEAQTGGKKREIDKAVHDQKVANSKAFSNAFGALLKGDVLGFLQSSAEIVQGEKNALQQRLEANMAHFEQGAAMAQQAVDFLNNLAQAKAEKAIAAANRERDEKVAILNNELAVTESLITSSSNYVTALKSAETDRLAELQRILTAETSTEEQKRDALKKYYSDQLKQMKAAEEAKIQDLQHLANMAKTEDEKQAIEAKIALAKKESEEKIRLAEEEMQAKKTNIDELNIFTADISAEALADAQKASDKQIDIATDEAEKKADFKIELEETIAAENRKARETEMAEKKKAFQAQKKADIATALITGALAVLKALANFFPLNIILAATAAVVTGVQIAKIKNQPDPSFAQGGTLGHVPQGGKHGSTYGTGGIGLFDRATGRDVGEMEGGEAIISTSQTEANWPLIQQMFRNARTPGKANTPVIPHPATPGGAPPIAFRDGGKFESPYFERGMYLFGSKKKKAEQAAKDAEAEAAKAQAEADAAMADMPSFDGGAYSGIDGSSIDGGSPESQAAFEASQKQGMQQLQLLQDIVDAATANGESLGRVVSIVSELKGSVNAVESAVNGVKDAVYNTNTQGKFDALIGAISSMSA